jgi:hypothetical protein
MKLFKMFNRASKGETNIVLLIVIVCITTLVITILPGITAVNSQMTLTNALATIAQNNYVAWAIAGLSTGQVPYANSSLSLTGESALSYNATSNTLSVDNIDSPTGRGATYVIAASDAPAHVKAQADYVCDGTADDVQIQAAVDALSINGGNIYLSAGGYNLDTGIVVTGDSVAIAGAGVATHLTCALSGFSVTGNNFSIKNLWLTGTSDLNNGVYARQDTTGIIIENITVNDFVQGILIASVDKVTIKNNYCYSNGLDGIYVKLNTLHNRSSNVLIMGNRCISNARKNIAVENTDYAQISHNYVELSGTGDIDCESNVYQVVINDNHSVNSGGAAAILVDGTCTNSIIENNIIISPIGIGIRGGGDSIIRGNIVYDNGDYAIGYGKIISGNRIEAGEDGIDVLVEGAIVSGNVIEDTTANSSTGGPIHVGDKDNVLVEGNIIRNNHGSFNYYSGVTALVVRNNQFYNNTDVPYYPLGQYPNVTWRDNIGYIARGEIRTYSGTIATLTENAYNSVDNPFGQAVRVLSLDIYLSTNATSTAPNIDCGIGSSATTDYTTLFDDLPGETAGFYNSLITTPGAQTVPILWASGSGNRYLNMSIKDAAATGMVATYTVTVMGN